MVPTSCQFSPRTNPKYTYTNVIGVIAKNVYRQKTHTFIFAIPHGMEIRVLTYGINRPLNATNPPCFSKKASDLSSDSGLTKKYFPYLFKKGLPP